MPHDYHIKSGSCLDWIYSSCHTNMKFALLCILAALYVLRVNGDSIADLKKLANSVAHKTLVYDQEFFNSVITMLNNMKDLSAFSLFDTWNLTHLDFDNVNKSAKTKEQKDCIASERKKLTDIILGVASSLFLCGRHSLEFTVPIRKKIQNAHRESMLILSELQSVKEFCSSRRDKPGDECISLKLEKLESSLKDLLQQLVTFKIEGSTIKPKILGDSLNCNAEVLTGTNKEITNVHKRLKECVQ